MRTCSPAVWYDARRRGEVRLSPVTLTAAWAVAASFGSPARADARFQIDSPLNLFVDQSWVVWTPNRVAIRGDPESPVHPIFEAQIAPNLFLPQLHIGSLTDPAGELVISAVVTPMIRLRMLNEKSSPVIPPSFMPRLTLQIVNLRP